jgi:transcriptional regulator with XRE-family HTH domain
METNNSSFAQRLFQARLAYSAEKGRQVTQAELAELVGVSTATWSTWEAGRSEPPLDTIGKVARVLNVGPGWLAFGIPMEQDAEKPLGAKKPQKRKGARG